MSFGSMDGTVASRREVSGAMLQALKYMVPAIVFLLALAPRLYHLGDRPFWYDEVRTVERCSLGLHGMIADAFSQRHTPVYFLLVRPSVHMAPVQFWLRLPSAIFGALAVALVYLIAKRAADWEAGIAAAMILALSPIEIAYSQEARSYALVTFCLLVALHGLTGLVLREDRAALSWWKAGAPRADWLQLVAGSAGAFCTLGDSLPWLLVVDATAAMLISRADDRAGMLRNFLMMNAFALGACLPLYGLMLHFEQSSFHAAVRIPLSWKFFKYDVDVLYLMRIADFDSAKLMGSNPLVFSWMIGAGLIAAVITGVRRIRDRPALMRMLLLAFLVLPVLFVLLSFWDATLKPRYLLWSSAPFAILAGIGISGWLLNFRRPARLAALAAVAVLLLVNLSSFYQAEIKPRWDIAAQLIAAEMTPENVFYFNNESFGLPLSYYLPDRLQAGLAAHYKGDNLADAVQAHGQGHRVWAMYSSSWFAVRGRSPATFYATLYKLGTPASILHAGSSITIWRFDPPAGAKAP